jgi:hypothetical protein
MPIELILSPLMRPVVMAKAVLFHPHRKYSRYVPNIVEIDEGACSYTVRKEFGQGGKIFNVFDDANPLEAVDQRLYSMVRSRAVKGAYKIYTQGEEKPTAAIRAGLRSNVLLIKNTEDRHFELGWHVVGHRVDAIDSYRLFQLSDGQTFQWSTKGKTLERVHNLGEKESEVREIVAKVVPHGFTGFNIKVDETKISREMAIFTAMISYIDQWNTALGVGGIYYTYQPYQIRWKRD